MKKSTWKKLLVSALSLAVCCVCGGLASVTAFAEDATTPSSIFEMEAGASVRVIEPSGIRFTTDVSKSVYEGYTDPVCGTLIISTKALGDGELTLSTPNVENIEAENWLQFDSQYDTYKYTGVLIGSIVEGEDGAITYTGLNEAYWNVSLSAVGYIYEKDDVSSVRYTNKEVRSMAQSASMALASGMTDDFLKTICDTVVGNDLAFTSTNVDAYAGDSTIDVASKLTGNKGLTAIWSSSDENVATVSDKGVVTMLKKGDVTITATIGTKTATCAISIEDVKYDDKAGLVSWTAIENATSYKVILNKRLQSTTGETAKEYTTTACSQNLYLSEEGLYLITVKAFNGEDELSTRAITAEVSAHVQKFGEVKDEDAGEYYIAEWSDPAAWGQFAAGGYKGGPSNGVTFTYGEWVYDDGDNQTRIHEGYLHIDSGKGWADGKFGINLPIALKVEDITSIVIKAKLTNTNNLVYYFNGSNHLPATGATISEADADGYKTYTISATQMSNLEAADKSKISIDAISTIYLSSGIGQTEYNIDVKEITYVAKTAVTHDKSIPEGASFITDFSDGVTFTHNQTSISDVATTADELESVDGIYSGASVKKVTYNAGWVGITINFVAPIEFNVNTHSLILQGATIGLENDTARFIVGYNGNSGNRQDDYRQDGIYSLNKHNYKNYGLSATNDILSISSVTLTAQTTNLVMYLDCLYLIENSKVSIPDGATQIVDVSDAETYMLAAKSGSWVCKQSTLSTDGAGHDVLVNTLAYSWNDAKQWNQYVNFSEALDMTDYETIYVAIDNVNVADFSAYIRQGDKACSITVTKDNDLTVYAISKSALEEAGLDITCIDGLSIAFKVGTFYLGGVWVK